MIRYSDKSFDEIKHGLKVTRISTIQSTALN